MTLQETAPGELRGPRTLADAKRWMHDRVAKGIHPFGVTDRGETDALIDQTPGLDGESWGRFWASAGDRHMTRGEQLEAAGDAAAAREAYRQAYGYYMLGRFPCPNHPAKEESYAKERRAYLAFGRLLPEPIARQAIPFDADGRPAEVVFYVRRPAGVAKPPVVIMWGGVDAWKEEMTEMSDLLLAQGVATVAMDNAGTGESPVVGQPGAERQFLAVMDWAAAQPDLDGARPCVVGRSFGGHWATRLAHLCPDRLSGAVNWGGGVHYMFQPEWVEASRYPESYLMELVETRSRMLGAANDREYVERFKNLSLVDAGLLDGPCAPMLLVNGKEDKQCPIADLYLLLDCGDPKSVRLFPGGHMGFGPKTVPTIVNWLVHQCRR